MAYDSSLVEEVFLAALKESAPEQRSAVIGDLCGNDFSLRRRVEALLAAHERAPKSLDYPAIRAVAEGASGGAFSGYTDSWDFLEPDGPRPSPDSLIGSIVAGRYLLTKLLGRGGMGAVYRAEQTEPVRRAVALKIVKSTTDGRNRLARFEAERQALALMDHPNIAKLFDAGQSGPLPNRGSRPFFVMELVDGLSITRYCDEKKLTLRERLSLMLPVCQAVQHAHHKGIIHRDLTRNNILIVETPDGPQPKIIDFGIAKAPGKRLTDRTIETMPGLFVGTPEYMSPEQAESAPDDIDTRTDIYALGVLLYELMSGLLPFDRDRLRKTTLSELLYILREEEPPPPSLRFRKSATQAEIAAVRSTEPTKLRRRLEGELDWVILKCLEKDRSRRYQSAGALGDDLQRVLNHEPVEAGAPTIAYRVSKFVRRHLAIVATAALLIVALLGGIAGTTWGMLQAQKAEKQALLDRDQTQKAGVRATEEAAVARAVAEFLENDVIRQADPARQIQQRFATNADLTVRTALERAAATINQRFGDQPRVKAEILLSIGRSYIGLAEPNRAVAPLTRCIPLFEQTLGPDHDTTSFARFQLAVAVRHSQPDKAIELLRKSIQRNTKHLGKDHWRTLEAEKFLALAHLDAGRPEECIQLLTDLVNRQRDTPNAHDALAPRRWLAYLLADRGRFDEAIRELEALREPWIALNGEDHPISLETLSILGRTYCDAGRMDDGIALLQDVANRSFHAIPLENDTTTCAVIDLAAGLGAAGRAKDAVAICEDWHTRCLAKLGAEHERTILSAAELAGWLFEAGDVPRAESICREQLPRAENHAVRSAKVRIRFVLGRCAESSRHFADAERHYRAAIEACKGKFNTYQMDLEPSLALALCLARSGNWDQAYPLLKSSRQEQLRNNVRIPWFCRKRVAAVLDALAECCEHLGRSEEANSWRRMKD